MADLVKKSNGVATAGMVLAIVAAVFFFLLWVPFFYILGWILNIVALVLSIIGVCKAPRGKAIVGLVLSATSWFIMPWLFTLLFIGAAF